MTQIVYSNSDSFIFLLYFSISMYRRVKTNLHLEGLHLIISERSNERCDADRLKDSNNGFFTFLLNTYFGRCRKIRTNLHLEMSQAYIFIINTRKD